VVGESIRFVGRRYRFTIKFPTQRNRELIGPYQGIKSAYQGSFLPDQGRVVSVDFWHGLL
jgi:hypothetical protein